MNRVFGRKKAPGPPAPSLGEASSGKQRVERKRENNNNTCHTWMSYIQCLEGHKYIERACDLLGMCDQIYK